MKHYLFQDDSGFAVFEQGGKFYVRYDAGAHQVEMREDEVSEAEAHEASKGLDSANAVLFKVQNRLIESGVDPYVSNVDDAGSE
ncbi:MAG: hypothetical protein QM774_06720 [Gordonia sp. (in: high G+C Gram-positive bacteria)]|uniref:hypothetical protein n=1 Tax=Gordonia sp. (in: high G+C Gram-positive bacteria) TaxID=84139 RepID=UPI0039E37F33